MSIQQTYKIAHTARCKLQLAADRPDRDLRFILGHAFTLDKLRLRIAEIEVGSSSDSSSSDEDLPEFTSVGVTASEAGERRVSFGGNKKGGAGVERRRSPPPPPQLEADTDSDSDSAEEDIEDEEEDLGLTRFGSAAAQPPRIVEEEVDEELSDGEEEAVNPSKYSEEEILELMEQGQESEELQRAYTKVAGCACHGEKGPKGEKFWEVPMKAGSKGPRMAVMQVAAAA